MTKINKIQILNNKGNDIQFHYWVGKNQRRLIIDSINNFNYNTTSKDQILAGLEIDTLYMEVVENDD